MSEDTGNFLEMIRVALVNERVRLERLIKSRGLGRPSYSSATEIATVEQRVNEMESIYNRISELHNSINQQQQRLSRSRSRPSNFLRQLPTKEINYHKKSNRFF